MANETDILARLRKGYLGQGYDVAVRPQIDDGAGGIVEPDLAAAKAGRVILVGVRALSPAAGADGAARLRRLAEAAEARPDWTFRLVLAEPEAPAPDLPATGEVGARLGEARRLLRRGEAAAAMLFAWAILAGAARRRVTADADMGADQGPVALAHLCVAEGLADQDDLGWLLAAAQLAAALGAGELRRPVDRTLFDRVCGLAQDLADPMVAARRIVRPGGAGV
ncbi:MAG: hypothetical protein ACFB6R_00155 [Alphaproteobacteria bacterium]